MQCSHSHSQRPVTFNINHCVLQYCEFNATEQKSRKQITLNRFSFAWSHLNVTFFDATHYRETAYSKCLTQNFLLELFFISQLLTNAVTNDKKKIYKKTNDKKKSSSNIGICHFLWSSTTAFKFMTSRCRCREDALIRLVIIWHFFIKWRKYGAWIFKSINNARNLREKWWFLDQNCFRLQWQMMTINNDWPLMMMVKMENIMHIISDKTCWKKKCFNYTLHMCQLWGK